MRLLSFLLFALASATLQSQNACNAFFPFEEGVALEYATFDKKGKLESTAAHNITQVETGEEGVSATVATHLSDKKGKDVMDGEYTVTCKDNTLYMDVSNLLPSEMMTSFSAMDIEVSGDALQMPSTLKVGQVLPDATTQIKAASGGLNLMTMTVTITDRKVEAQEKVETPAGAYECYKITYTTNSKMLISKSFQMAEWYAESIGVVRSETYNKNGKLQSSMELQRYEKK